MTTSRCAQRQEFTMFKLAGLTAFVIALPAFA